MVLFIIACGGPRARDFFGISFRRHSSWVSGSTSSRAAAAAATDRVRGRTRLALGRCHVRQAADGSGVGQLLEYEVRFSQVLARRQRRQRRRQRRLRWRRERRLPSGSARPRDITGDQKIECWLNVLGLGIPREMRDLSCSKPKNFPACRRLSEVRGRAVHAVREGAPQPPWVPLTADPATRRPHTDRRVLIHSLA